MTGTRFRRGFHRRRGSDWQPTARRANQRRAHPMGAGDVRSSSMRNGAGKPASRDQKAGQGCPARTAMTGTPRVSRTSSVLGRSRIALAPAQTTVTGVCASSCKSAEISKAGFGAMVHPADAAGGENLDPGEVCGDHRGGHRGRTRCRPWRGKRPYRRATVWRRHRSWRKLTSSGSSPMCRSPSITAMVAGTAPSARMSSSTARATSTFCGYGIPWVMIVLSSATSGHLEGTGAGDFGTDNGMVRGSQRGFSCDIGGGTCRARVSADCGFRTACFSGDMGGHKGIARAGHTGHEDLRWRGADIGPMRVSVSSRLPPSVTTTRCRAACHQCRSGSGGLVEIGRDTTGQPLPDSRRALRIAVAQQRLQPFAPCPAKPGATRRSACGEQRALGDPAPADPASGFHPARRAHQ